MSKNYLIYPCKTMRITQSYTGTTSHLPHTTGFPKDYPIDEGCSDTGRDYICCPCDKMKIKRIYGVGTRGTNTLWLESTSKVYFADGTKDYCTLLITHPDDVDLKNLWVGQVFTRKEKICREGKDGATGYHLHLSAGKGKYKGNGWTPNSRGKYVLTTKGGAFKPEDLFFVDPDFTKVVNDKGLNFKKLPEEYTTGKYEVTTEELRVRSGPGTEYEIVPYEKFKAAGKKQIKALKGDSYKKNFFVKGMKLSIKKIKDNWGKCPSGWVCLDFCKKSK